VGLDDHSEPRLEIQGLPRQASGLPKKFFSNDNSVSVLLGSFNLNVDMFSDSFAAGLVPIFFSESRKSASTFLKKNPEMARDAIASVNSRLLRMEHMSLQEAITHLNAKKGRPAKGVSAFPAPATTRKRGRPSGLDLAGSGT
jgi:hypothetical protein